MQTISCIILRACDDYDHNNHHPGICFAQVENTCGKKFIAREIPLGNTAYYLYFIAVQFTLHCLVLHVLNFIARKHREISPPTKQMFTSIHGC